MILRFLLMIVALNLAPHAFAQDDKCTTTSERPEDAPPGKTQDLGTIAGRKLEVWTCEVWGPGNWQIQYVDLMLYKPGSTTDFDLVNPSPVINDASGGYQTSFKMDGPILVTRTIETSRYSDGAGFDTRYRFDTKAGKFVEVSRVHWNTYADAMKRTMSLAAKGKFCEAHAEMHKTGTMTEGGRVDDSTAWRSGLLRAYHKLARSKFDEKDKTAAANAAREFFFRTPDPTCPPQFTTSPDCVAGVEPCREQSKHCWGEGGGECSVAWSDGETSLVLDLIFFLDQVGDHHGAMRLWSGVMNPPPLLFLNFGDALYAIGDQWAANLVYRSYLEQLPNPAKWVKPRLLKEDPPGDAPLVATQLTDVGFPTLRLASDPFNSDSLTLVLSRGLVVAGSPCKQNDQIYIRRISGPPKDRPLGWRIDSC